MKYFESLTPLQKELISQHLDLVIRANETTNLTRIDDKDEAFVLHVEDSLAGMRVIENAPKGLYGDLGSGAGYPGIPLAIATGRKTVLIDSRQKKMKIMEGIIEELRLSTQITTFAGRAELLARKQPKSFAVLTARALSSLPVLMELASPLLMKHGRLVCYKARIDEDEMVRAKRVQKQTGMKFVKEEDFLLEGEFERRLIVFEKAAMPLINLPRKEGEAQKNPLGA